MKAILIMNMELPEPQGMLDVRIYGDGTAVMVCGPGNANTYKVEEIELPEEKN